MKDCVVRGTIFLSLFCLFSWTVFAEESRSPEFYMENTKIQITNTAFSDVPHDHATYVAIVYLSQNGIIKGYVCLMGFGMMFDDQN